MRITQCVKCKGFDCLICPSCQNTKRFEKEQDKPVLICHKCSYQMAGSVAHDCGCKIPIMSYKTYGQRIGEGITGFFKAFLMGMLVSIIVGIPLERTPTGNVIATIILIICVVFIPTYIFHKALKEAKICKKGMIQWRQEHGEELGTT